MRFSGRIDFSAETNELDRERSERRRLGAPILDLSQSNPTRTGLIFPAALASKALSSAENSSYCPDPRGLPAARAAIAAHLSATGPAAEESRLLLCASTSEAYSYLFKLLCDPGEAVLVPRPGYPLFDHLAALESVRAVGYRLEYEHPWGWSIDLSGLSALLESPENSAIKAIVLINPNNPTGSYVRAAELDSILALCARHSIAIIADEVFFDYQLDPASVPVSLRGASDIPIFTLDGLSKRLCLPQMKLGWIHVGGPEREARRALSALELISDNFLSAGAPIMNAVGELLAAEAEIQAAVNTRMKTVMGIYREILCGDGSSHRLLRCGGGWTALVSSPRFASEDELARGLLREEGLFVHPGYFFDMEKEAHFAFSLILRPEEAREAALKYRDFFARF
jgi:alanine-synthesizing transaminase